MKTEYIGLIWVITLMLVGSIVGRYAFFGGVSTRYRDIPDWIPDVANSALKAVCILFVLPLMLYYPFALIMAEKTAFFAEDGRSMRSWAALLPCLWIMEFTLWMLTGFNKWEDIFWLTAYFEHISPLDW